MEKCLGRCWSTNVKEKSHIAVKALTHAPTAQRMSDWTCMLDVAMVLVDKRISTQGLLASAVSAMPLKRREESG